VLTCATGRAHRHLAKVDGGIRGRQNHNGRHVATSKTEWPAEKSPSADHRADKKIALSIYIS
jgi:hypothetical protein